MPNQYTKLTKKNIERKLNRKHHPVTNMTQLATEFGYNTFYSRSYGYPSYGSAAPGGFRKKVKALMGESGYNKIRDERFVPKAYR